ncbi:MAG: hypothetical protein DDT29_02007 [Dehalococcoidia bacterium]|nr:hypothetical protein [Bacillota bacterium]
MRKAAMALGILAGLLGAGWFYYESKGLTVEIPVEQLAWVLFLCTMGFGGGVLALIKPAVAGILMLISGIGSFAVALIVGYAPLTLPLIAGGALALAACAKQPAARAAASALGILAGILGALGAYITFFLRPGELLYSLMLFLFPLIAIAGGVIVLSRPAVGGILMVVTWIGFFCMACMVADEVGFCPQSKITEILLSIFACITASLLLLAGAILALADPQSRSVARIVPLVLGISAGVIGALGVYGGVPVVPGGFLALGVLLSTMGIAGAVLTRSRPGVAGTLMLVSGIGGFAVAFIVPAFGYVGREADTFSIAYAIAGFPMIVGGVLSLVSREKGDRNLET